MHQHTAPSGFGPGPRTALQAGRSVAPTGSHWFASASAGPLARRLALAQARQLGALRKAAHGGSSAVPAGAFARSPSLPASPLTDSGAPPLRPAGRTSGCRPTQQHHQPVVCRAHDYEASPSDNEVLRLPARTELTKEQIRSVYGWPSNLQEKYFLGQIVGAGSFGIVRQCLEIATGRKYAVKTLSKTPKKGAPNPR